MSERTDDRDVLALLDRAAGHVPPLHLDRAEVVGRGRQIVRRRRVGAGGAGLAALALVGTVWLGLGEGSVLTSSQVVPASVSWEVEGPTTLTLLEDVGLGDERFTVTVTKEPGRARATFVVDGAEQTVEGATGAGGSDVFVAERGTLVLWEQPRRSSGYRLVPEPTDGFATGGPVGEGGAYFFLTSDAGYVPSDLLFHSDRAVWTAGGEVAATARLEEGGVVATAFSLPGLGLGGFLEDGHPSPTFLDPASVFVSGGKEPWWRGGDDLTIYLHRLPAEARWVRPVLDGAVTPRALGEQVPATVSGDSAWAVSVLTEEQMRGAAIWGAAEWSTDGITWRTVGEDDGTTTGTAAPVGDGGIVSLLGQPYTVSTDDHGWPLLLDEDGQPFLTVSDSEGPSAGGVSTWREHWWPWSERRSVHFYVDWQPPSGAEVVMMTDGGWFEPADVVTVSGPEGVVTLLSVRPEDHGRPVNGLGLRTEDGITPVTPD